jgi:hypothetical protein
MNWCVHDYVLYKELDYKFTVISYKISKITKLVQIYMPLHLQIWKHSKFRVLITDDNKLLLLEPWALVQ